MNADDRELLMLLGTVNIRVSEMVTGLFEDSLSCVQLLSFAEQLIQLAEGLRERATRTPALEDV